MLRGCHIQSAIIARPIHLSDARISAFRKSRNHSTFSRSKNQTNQSREGNYRITFAVSVGTGDLVKNLQEKEHRRLKIVTYKWDRRIRDVCEDIMKRTGVVGWMTRRRLALHLQWHVQFRSIKMGCDKKFLGTMGTIGGWKWKAGAMWKITARIEQCRPKCFSRSDCFCGNGVHVVKKIKIIGGINDGICTPLGCQSTSSTSIQVRQSIFMARWPGNDACVVVGYLQCGHNIHDY